MEANKLVFLHHKSEKETSEYIVLVHGMDSCKETWTPVIESEKLKNFNIFAVDLHGHGETPNQNDTFTTKQMITDLHNFIIEQSIPQFYLIGHSMGSRVSIPYCSKFPETVKGLIIVDMDIKIYDIPEKIVDELKTFKDVVNNEDELFSEYERFGYDQDRVKKWIKDGRIKKKNDVFYCGIRPYISFSSAKNLLSTKDAHEAFVELSKENVKILLLEAEKGSAVSSKSLELMRKINPNMQHVKVKNSTHSIHKDDSHDEFIQLIIEFMS